MSTGPKDPRDPMAIQFAKLAEERDSARQSYRVLERMLRDVLGDVEETMSVFDVAKRVVAERDAARLELRALEWLAITRAAFCTECDGLLVAIVEGRNYRGATWAEIARALGWEG